MYVSHAGFQPSVAKPGMQRGLILWTTMVPEEDEEQFCLWHTALSKAAQHRLEHKLAHVGPMLLHELGCLSWHEWCVFPKEFWCTIWEARQQHQQGLRAA